MTNKMKEILDGLGIEIRGDVSQADDKEISDAIAQALTEISMQMQTPQPLRHGFSTVDELYKAIELADKYI